MDELLHARVEQLNKIKERSVWKTSPRSLKLQSRQRFGT